MLEIKVNIEIAESTLESLSGLIAALVTNTPAKRSRKSVKQTLAPVLEGEPKSPKATTLVSVPAPGSGKADASNPGLSPATAPKIEPVDSPKEDEGVEEISVEELRAAGNLAVKKNIKAVRKMLSDFGASKITGIEGEQREKALETLNKIITS